jgi:Mg2+-importing ATPase
LALEIASAVVGSPPTAGKSPQGLSSAEALRLISLHGVNEPVPRRRATALYQLLQLIANPLVGILAVASVISLALRHGTDAAIIIVTVASGVGINFWQSYRSERAADRLRASVAPTATVQRDGVWREIPVRGLVPGDLIQLSAGDLVPADAALVASRDLSVHEAALTGESLPADKHVPDAIFLGTSVVSGTATAVVTTTGPRTRLGEIARRIGSREAESSEFDHGLRRFSLLILRTTIALVLFILLVSLFLKRDPIESLLFAVALGVGLTPEFLPMIASVTLTAGAVRMAKEGVIIKHLPAIQNFGSIDVLCSDKTGTLTRGEMHLERSVDPSGTPSPRPQLLAAVNSRFESGVRNPLNAAIVQASSFDLSGWRKVDEVPFDFERRRTSVAVDDPARRRLLIVKGAPESVLAASAACETAAGAAVACTPEMRARASALCESFGREGLRVLAVAWRELDPRPAYGRGDERELTLCGFLAFADPVLPDAAAALAVLARDGVMVKILTGDNDRVARHVCEQVGIPHEDLVTGDDLDGLDDAALAAVAEKSVIFARVSPAQKNRVIAALRRRGHVVGFMGDGINDAPSLRSADIGISVASGTDVARESADVILGRSGLAVLHRGILEGRRASGNMVKYLLMGTSSNFGNMFSMAAASVFLPFLPMLPTQILLNNLLYDIAQIAIPTDHVDREYLRRPQRWDMRVIRNFMLVAGPISSVFDFLTFYVLLQVLHATEPLFHTGWFVESLATQTLVLFVIRTAGGPLADRPSRALTWTVLAVVAAGLILPVSPLAPVLGFAAPPLAYMAFLGGATMLYLLVMELVKRRVLPPATRAAWRWSIS